MEGTGFQNKKRLFRSKRNYRISRVLPVNRGRAEEAGGEKKRRIEKKRKREKDEEEGVRVGWRGQSRE